MEIDVDHHSRLKFYRRCGAMMRSMWAWGWTDSPFILAAVLQLFVQICSEKTVLSRPIEYEYACIRVRELWPVHCFRLLLQIIFILVIPIWWRVLKRKWDKEIFAFKVYRQINFKSAGPFRGTTGANQMIKPKNGYIVSSSENTCWGSLHTTRHDGNWDHSMHLVVRRYRSET